MKIYTEITYEWIDGEGLVEISSDSFDYEGEVALCWSFPKVSIPNPITIVTENLDDAGGMVTEGLSSGTEVISEGMTYQVEYKISGICQKCQDNIFG